MTQREEAARLSAYQRAKGIAVMTPRAMIRAGHRQAAGPDNDRQILANARRSISRSEATMQRLLTLRSPDARHRARAVIEKAAHRLAVLHSRL